MQMIHFIHKLLRHWFLRTKKNWAIIPGGEKSMYVDQEKDGFITGPEEGQDGLHRRKMAPAGEYEIADLQGPQLSGSNGDRQEMEDIARALAKITVDHRDLDVTRNVSSEMVRRSRRFGDVW
jgi:hypothetical protein